MGRSSFVYIRLLMLTGKVEELHAALAKELEHALAKDELSEIAYVARMYDESGQFELFRTRVNNTVSKHRAERILDYISERPKVVRRSPVRFAAG
jgi:hypothetical protein